MTATLATIFGGNRATVEQIRADANRATVEEIQDWCISIRPQIPNMTQDELDYVEVVLSAMGKRMRQLGQAMDEIERVRIRMLLRKGQLLDPPTPKFHGNRYTASASQNGETLKQVEYNERHRARLLADYPEVVEKVIADSKPTLNRAVNACKQQRAAERTADVEQRMAEAVVIDGETTGGVGHSKWWQLGPHLLYCGDSADQEFIDRCEGAKFAFADPPYNTGKADWDHGFTWRHDYLVDVASIVAVTPGNSAIQNFYVANTTMPYLWSISAVINNGRTRGALGFGNWIYVALFSRSGSLHRDAQDVITISVDASTTPESSHECRKPSRLLVELIELFTDEGDLVVDPFLGSGTTLFAAEETGRRCVGAEINQKFCAEIIARYGPNARPL